MREKAIERALCRHVAKVGGLCLKLSGPIGFPDRTILWPNGRVEFIELKSPSGRLSDKQTLWLRTLHGLGFSVYVIRSLDEVKELLP